MYVKRMCVWLCLGAHTCMYVYCALMCVKMAVPAQASDPRRVECLRRNLALPPRGGPFPPQIEMNFCSQTGVFAGVRPRISLGGILFSKYTLGI